MGQAGHFISQKHLKILFAPVLRRYPGQDYGKVRVANPFSW